MYSQRRYDSPPTYSPRSAYVQSVSYIPPGDPYNGHSPGPGSYYMEDMPQEFYKWKSPPGIVRILQGVIVLLCIAIFACVASTLAWQYNYGMMGLGSMGSMGGYYGGGGGYYGGSMGGMGGYGYGGMTNPQAASGFMMAMAVVCFVAILAFFVMSVSKSSGSRSRKFYLVVIIVSAILAFLVAIASIVYIVGVNPRAQMTGGLYYSQMMMLCNQVYSPMGGVGMMNQYLYHYCIVDPQEVFSLKCQDALVGSLLRLRNAFYITLHFITDAGYLICRRILSEFELEARIRGSFELCLLDTYHLMVDSVICAHSIEVDEASVIAREMVTPQSVSFKSSGDKMWMSRKPDRLDRSSHFNETSVELVPPQMAKMWMSRKPDRLDRSSHFNETSVELVPPQVAWKRVPEGNLLREVFYTVLSHLGELEGEETYHCHKSISLNRGNGNGILVARSSLMQKSGRAFPCSNCASNSKSCKLCLNISGFFWVTVTYQPKGPPRCCCPS